VAFYLSIYPYFQSYLLVVQGQSVSTSGHIVQTFTFSATITGLVVSLIIKRTKHYKYFVVFGTLVYLLGLALMMRYRAQGASTLVIVGTQVVVGIGGGLVNGPAQLGVQAAASHQSVASATAIFLTILEIGGAVGNAISGAIWSHSIPEKLALYLPPETKDQAAAIFGNVTLAANGWPMGSPTRDAINLAYQETMTRILTVAVCVAAPCVLLSFFMKNYKLDEIDQHVKGVVVGGVQEAADRRNSMATASRRSSSMPVPDENTTPALPQDSDDTALFQKPRKGS
jgi:hypothetical protein